MLPKFIKSMVPLKARVRYNNWKVLGTDAGKNPLMFGYNAAQTDRDRAIQSQFETYTTTISTPVAAVSLELARFLVAALHKLQPRVAVDLGSGFSSYLLRNYAAQCGHPCVVYSCDDDAHWLQRTADFLTEKKLSSDNLLLWDDFCQHHAHIVPDILLHDMGNSVRRISELPRVLDWCSKGCVAILDDMQKPAVREAALAGIKQRNLVAYDLSLATYDSYNRFSWMVFSQDKERELARKFTS
jgi:hypothetical protein